VSRPASDQGGEPSVVVEQRARTHPIVVMLRDERVLLGRLAESAHRCGIEERLLRQVELDGQSTAKVMNAILADPELGLTHVQRSAVPRHLRSMDQVV
jgi:hypothetical protein